MLWLDLTVPLKGVQVFGKSVLVILSIGVGACALLALRQSRLQAASEMVRIQLEIRAQDEELWLLRTQIAQQVTPEQVRQLMSEIGPLKPLESSFDDPDERPLQAAGETPKVQSSPASKSAPQRGTKPGTSEPKAPAQAKPRSASGERRFAADHTQDAQ